MTCFWLCLSVLSSQNGIMVVADSAFRAPMSFFNSVDTGIILNRFSQDMTSMETPLALGFLFTVLSGFCVRSNHIEWYWRVPRPVSCYRAAWSRCFGFVLHLSGDSICPCGPISTAKGISTRFTPGASSGSWAEKPAIFSFPRKTGWSKYKSRIRMARREQTHLHKTLELLTTTLLPTMVHTAVA